MLKLKQVILRKIVSIQPLFWRFETEALLVKPV